MVSNNNNNVKKSGNGNSDVCDDKILNELDAAPAKEEPKREVGFLERLNNSIEEIMPCSLPSSSGNKINPMKMQFDAVIFSYQ